MELAGLCIVENQTRIRGWNIIKKKHGKEKKCQWCSAAKKKKKMKINGDSQRNPQFDHGYVGKFIFLRQHLASKETLKSFIEQVVSNG